ncbi:MAG: hypothetical protein OEV78_07385 [Spirochaetia bacterium]|nr:hypothetical protein [Spirochaetia bacterium]
MRKLFAIIYLLSAILCFNIYGNSLALSDNLQNKNNEEQNLLKYLYLYEDKSSNLTIKDILNPENQKKFTLNKKAYPAYSFTKSAIWGKFTLRNNSQKAKERYLLFEFPLLEHISLYTPDQNGRFKEIKYGKDFAFDKREILHRKIVIPLNIVADDESTFYFRVVTDETMELPVKIITATTLARTNYVEMFFSGLYYGILFVMFFYNFFIFLTVREKSYIYYVLYILSFGIAQAGLDGYLDEIINTTNYQFLRDLRVYLGAITMIVIILFSTSYLNIKTEFPRIYFVFMGLIILSLLPIFVLWKSGFYYGIQMTLFLMIGMSIFLIYVGVLAAKRNESARYFLAAWIFFLLGVIIYGAKTANLFIPFFTPFSMQIGNAIEVTILSFGLAHRIRVLQLEKERVSETFGKVVDPAIRDYMLKGNLEMGGKEKIATILFCDIRKFTELSEKHNPELIVKILNRYLEALSQEVSLNHGLVNKYIGDAVMAIFNVPLESPSHCDNAIRSAIAMSKALESLNHVFISESLPTLKMGIGIHTGTVLAGNIGSSVRMEYTVIGDNVNIASRMEDLTKLYNTQILVSDSVVKELKNPQEFQLREIDSVYLKGKSNQVKIYEVYNCNEVSVSNQKSSYAVEFQAARQLYISGKFNQAEIDFQKIAQQCPQDTVLQVFIKRCKDLQNFPPEEEWSGIFNLTSKSFDKVSDTIWE